MTRTTFFLLSAVTFAIATLAVGIRGVDSWAPHEFMIYYGMLGWGAHFAYHRYVRPVAE